MKLKRRLLKKVKINTLKRIWLKLDNSLGYIEYILFTNLIILYVIVKESQTSNLQTSEEDKGTLFDYIAEDRRPDIATVS